MLYCIALRNVTAAECEEINFIEEKKGGTSGNFYKAVSQASETYKPS